MEIALKRQWVTPVSTISTLEIDGVRAGYALEDTDRGLQDSMDIARINSLKVFGKTAIPYGRYQVIITHSARFNRLLPELVGVKGFAGIRIHSGNTALDTEGCILVGESKAADMIFNSRKCFDIVFSDISSAIAESKKVWVTILKGDL